MKDYMKDAVIIRSGRKSVSARFRSDGVLEIRAPYNVSEKQISAFINANQNALERLEKKCLSTQETAAALGSLTPEEIAELTEKAKKYIPERVSFYASKVGVSYGKITIRSQKSRWGSCSSKGNLNFNCLLMLTPPEVIDSVVVHELCHRIEMNHSEKFYSIVYGIFPDYERCSKWLKKNGRILMKRMENGKDK